MLRVDAEGFWRLMATCPAVRQGIMANAAQRIHAFQATTLHREKLISLGTLAAGSDARAEQSGLGSEAVGGAAARESGAAAGDQHALLPFPR